MPYKLLLSEEISPAIRRMALEQLTRARRELSAAENVQASVHQARKCLKRTRSLLRLARPIVGEAFFKAENKALRNLGRALASPREAGALLETVVRFEAAPEFAGQAALLGALKKQIVGEKLARESELEMVALTSLIGALDEAIEAWQNLPHRDAAFSDLAAGFGYSYERGRKSLKRALKRSDTFYLHEWRKDVQQCWRQMQVLTLIWPEDIMPRIRMAREISKLLGTEHDLSELTDYIRTHKRFIDKEAGLKCERKRLMREIKGLQRELCLHSVERGRRLYALEPMALVEAMTVYWRTGRAMQPMPGVVRLLADIKDPAAQAAAPKRQMRGPLRQGRENGAGNFSKPPSRDD